MSSLRQSAPGADVSAASPAQTRSRLLTICSGPNSL